MTSQGGLSRRRLLSSATKIAVAVVTEVRRKGTAPGLFHRGGSLHDHGQPWWRASERLGDGHHRKRHVRNGSGPGHGPGSGQPQLTELAQMAGLTACR